MTTQPGAALASSQWSPRESRASDASNNVPTGHTTPFELTECSQTNMKEDIKLITAYLVKERAPEAVQAALGRIALSWTNR
jgi:hypothetical protein